MRKSNIQLLERQKERVEQTGAIGREKDNGISGNWGKPAGAKAFCGVCWQIDAWKRGGQMARTLCTEGPKHPP